MRVSLIHHQWGFVTVAALTASILGCGGSDTAPPAASNPPAGGGVSTVGAAAGVAPMAGMPAPGGAQNPQPGMMAQHGAPAMPGGAHGGALTNPAAAMQTPAAPSAHGADAGTAQASAHAPPALSAPTTANATPHAGAPGTPAAGHGALTPPAGANPPGAAPAAGHGAPNPALAANIPAQPGANPAAHGGAAAGAALAAGAPAAPAGNPMPDNLAAGNPNPGQPGNAPGANGTGGASAITGEPGSTDYVLSKLIAMAKSGDYTGIESIVSEKAKGLAAEFREQDLKPTQIEAYKVTFDGLQPLNRKAAGGNGIQFTMKKGETFVQVTLIKENGSFKIKEMQIRDGKK